MICRVDAILTHKGIYNGNVGHGGMKSHPTPILSENTGPDPAEKPSNERTSMTEPITYGPYSLVVNLAGQGSMVIRRQDSDHKRTVAFVETIAQWDRFVAGLKSGLDEVQAVHSIDS
jgi:hypothetical protein